MQDQGATLLTVRAAARVTGKDERTLRRWIALGKLAAVHTPDGRRLSREELLRAGLLRHSPENQDIGAGTGPASVLQPDPLTAARLRELENRVRELETERDAWRQQAERLAMALPAARANAPRTPWWRRRTRPTAGE